MIAHVDATEGAAGDLLLAALIDAGAPVGAIRDALATLPIENLRFEAPEERVRGFRVRRLEVDVAETDTHRGLSDVLAILEAGRLPARALDRARRVFERLAAAEAHCHGVTVEEVHFHEVGALDAVLDVAGVAVALELLDVDELTHSPLGLGSGRIDTAHGSVPVPVPAVLELVRGVPVRRTGAPTEILTPTGAAILTTLGTPVDPSNREATVFERVGVSAGRREFPGGPSLLRVSIGRRVATAPAASGWETDEVVVLETDLDDLPGEVFPAVIESLLSAGALDALLTPVLMKKGRPGHTLRALAPPEQAEAIAQVIFRETTTLGIRRREWSRWILRRQIRSIESKWGAFRVKAAEWAPGRWKAAPEHDDLREISRREGVPLREVYEEAHKHIRYIEWDGGGSQSGNRAEGGNQGGGGAGAEPRSP